MGYKVETLIDYETLSKMKKLLKIVGGRILLKESHCTFVRLIIEKGLNTHDSGTCDNSH
ncbi:MAG: hypothetical protein JRJ43_01085 [Deltaproteobacteria bacterium]|nr:hypothetical protein [Deltaproteobacteria bacterium]